MRFTTPVPQFTEHHGWGSVLAGIGAGIGGFFLGGPGTAVALGSAAYQAANAKGAEKKAAQQQQAGYQQAIDAYRPYHAGGVAAANKLGDYLGLGADAFGAPGLLPSAPVGPTSPRGLARLYAATSELSQKTPSGQSLASLFTTRTPPPQVASVPRGRSLPSGSGNRSSYTVRSAV